MHRTLRLFVVPAVIGLVAGVVSARLGLGFASTLLIATAAAVAGTLSVARGHGLADLLNRLLPTYAAYIAKPALSTKRLRKVKLAALKKGRKREYRKGKRQDTWHFCTNCEFWPTSDYVSLQGKPSEGEMCNTCLAKLYNKCCFH
jgi:hypothetical protein